MLQAIMSVLLVGLASAAAHACPTCKESLATAGGNQAGLVQGYFWSIIFMMSMPFVILSGLSLYMYSLVRRARRDAATGSPVPLTQMEEPAVRC
jgi:heme/copper-type cytochrome/quinol oxidase subunit 2